MHPFFALAIEVPEWAVTDESQAWCLGFGAMALVRIFRACLKWFKRAGAESHD